MGPIRTKTLVAAAPTPAAVVLTPDEQQRLRDLWRDARAEATVRAYRTDWGTWEAWCQARGDAPLPAPPVLVALYANDLGALYKFGTIQRKVAAIAWVHRQTRLPSPTESPEVREALMALARRLGTAPEQKSAIKLDLLRRMTALLGDSPADLRDRSILLTGFFGAFRRSEFVGINANMVRWVPEGLVVHLARSKTDQEGEGRDVPIAARPDDQAMCPVYTLRRLIETVGPNADGFYYFGYFPDGTTRRGGHVDVKHVNRVIKELVAKLGIDAEDYSAHSLRAGLVTQADEDGATSKEIRRITGHTSDAMVDVYRRHENPFTGSAAALIGRGRTPEPAAAPSLAAQLAPTPVAAGPTLADFFSGMPPAAAVEPVVLPAPVDLPWDCEPALLKLYQRGFAWMQQSGLELAVFADGYGVDHPGSTDGLVLLVGKPDGAEAAAWLAAGYRILLVPGKPAHVGLLVG